MVGILVEKSIFTILIRQICGIIQQMKRSSVPYRLVKETGNSGCCMIAIMVRCWISATALLKTAAWLRI
jgi:hypothetical protein